MVVGVRQEGYGNRFGTVAAGREGPLKWWLSVFDFSEGT